MRIIITENQAEYLESERKELGAGVDHKVYTISSDDMKVVKVGDLSSINYYAKNFKKNENIFPKIYRYGKYKNKKNQYRGYMYVEKINNDEFKEYINKLTYFFSRNEIYQIMYAPNLLHNILDKKKLVNFKNVADKELINFFIDFIRVNLNLLDIKKRLGEKPNSTPMFRTELDLHFGNFGIDKNGKVKCLDF